MRLVNNSNSTQGWGDQRGEPASTEFLSCGSRLQHMYLVEINNALLPTRVKILLIF
jgi:hypothetical protein